jgi:hypothetical protein
MELVNRTKNVGPKCSFGLLQQVLHSSGVVHYMIDTNKIDFFKSSDGGVLQFGLVLDCVHHPVFQRTQRFGNWICFQPQGGRHLLC